MSNSTHQKQRMTFLHAAAGIAASTIVQAEELTAPFDVTAFDPGKAGDFDFLQGEWKISHRRLKEAGSNNWDVFDGEATCWSILNGVASIEELRIPARNFSGMGLRILDLEKKQWSDFWVNARSGVLTAPGVTGGFKNGVGIFVSEDVEQAKPILARGMWDKITPNACRWQQAVSHDDGKTWEDNWIMEWRRAV